MTSAPSPIRWRRTDVDGLMLVAVLLGLAAVQTAALAIQIVSGEIPCPLCLIERSAMFGIAFGLMLRLAPGGSPQGVGIAMVFAVFLLVVSARQVLLDIVPRPGHAYVGGAILGLHMPVWSVLIGLATLSALAIRTALFGDAAEALAPRSRAARLGRLAGLATTALCVVNLASVVLQCGAGACHTNTYALLP